MLVRKQQPSANATKPKSKEVEYLKGKKEKEIDMPMGKGTYGSMRGRPKKSPAMKKQAATAMSMKKAKKKPKKKM